MKKFRVKEKLNDGQLRFVPQFGYKLLPFIWFNFKFGGKISFINKIDVERFIEKEIRFINT